MVLGTYNITRSSADAEIARHGRDTEGRSRPILNTISGISAVDADATVQFAEGNFVLVIYIHLKRMACIISEINATKVQSPHTLYHTCRRRRRSCSWDHWILHEGSQDTDIFCHVLISTFVALCGDNPPTL